MAMRLRIPGGCSGSHGQAQRQGAGRLRRARQLSHARTASGRPATRSRWSCRCTCTCEAMPDDPKMQAFLYGPLVLAGDLGAEGLTEAHIIGPNLRVWRAECRAVRFAARRPPITRRPFPRSRSRRSGPQRRSWFLDQACGQATYFPDHRAEEGRNAGSAEQPVRPALFGLLDRLLGCAPAAN